MTVICEKEVLVFGLNHWYEQTHYRTRRIQRKDKVKIKKGSRIQGSSVQFNPAQGSWIFHGIFDKDSIELFKNKPETRD